MRGSVIYNAGVENNKIIIIIKKNLQIEKKRKKKEKKKRKVLACAGECWRLVVFPLIALVWRLGNVSDVGGSISHKLT